MKKLLAAAFALMAFGTAPQAATINATITGPTSILLGDSATFTLTYDPSSGPSSYSTVSGGGSIRIDNVQVASFTPSLLGGTVSFNSVFTTIGEHLISATGGLYFYSFITHCPNCGGSLQQVGQNNLSAQLRVMVTEPVATVPLPAAGFALIGALGSLAMLRRRRKAC